MTAHSLLRPVTVVFSLVGGLAPARALREPVRLPDQPAQTSLIDQAGSQRHHQVEQLCQRVEAFAALADDWDGYGAVPPSAEASSQVMTFLNDLPDSWAMRLHPDQLTPTPYGTITLEWTAPRGYLSVEVGDEQWTYLAEVDGAVQSSPNVAFPDAALSQEIAQVLGELFPDVVPQRVPAYTA